MTPKDYASMTDKVYEELRKQDWGTSAALELTKTYVTSGAYKNEPQNHEEE